MLFCIISDLTGEDFVHNPLCLFQSWWSKEALQARKICWKGSHGRHVPGSQTAFSSNPGHGQSEEGTSLVSVVAYCVYAYIPLFRRLNYIHYLIKISRKIRRILRGSQNSWSRIQNYFYPFSWRSKDCIKEKIVKWNTITWTIYRNTQNCRNPPCYARIDV